MTKTKNEIINSIKKLLDELETISDGKEKLPSGKQVKKLTGCIGAIQGLIDEGFFDEMKSVVEVISKLKQEGQPYTKQLISMNLLNLVKPSKRILRRINDGGVWKYIIRT